jgi:2-polyprenyl-3-methyl-5-hydroxy-6-metoxy-1,4-benzoquinol methylase
LQEELTMTDARLQRHPLGFLELAQKPTPEDLREYYAEKYYQQEQANYRKHYPPEELQAIKLRIALRRACALSLLQGTYPGNLLDVGCGEGFVLAAFAESGWDVEGIDYSRAGVEAMNPAYSRYVEHGDVFSLLDARIAEGRVYEMVWLGNVLEHVLDPLRLLEALHRLVAAQGLLVVTVPNDGNRYHEHLLATGAIEYPFWIAAPDHISYFTQESLRRIATETAWDCRALHGDFPIDWFLAHDGSNYARDRSRGPQAHQARIMLERLIAESGPQAANRFYAALADIGLGRNLTAFLTPRR